MKYTKKVENRITDYYKKVDDSVKTLTEHSRNLNSLYLQGKLKPVYNREELVTTISKILLRKSKPNVLLTGMAGCGKTAIAEALAISIAETALAWADADTTAKRLYNTAMKAYENGTGDHPGEYVEPKQRALTEYVVYDLSMNSLIGGTQYRGMFEERIKNLLKECENRKIILFIDEIHQMNSLGKNGDEPISLGQILKPALARGDIIVIGATTDEEAPLLLKDKALARRFTQVNVSELKGEGAKKTADGIFADYLKAHEIKADTALADIILQMINYYLPKTTFPDNFINVVDETLAGARYDELEEVNLDHFKTTIGRMAGVVIV